MKPKNKNFINKNIYLTIFILLTFYLIPSLGVDSNEVEIILYGKSFKKSDMPPIEEQEQLQKKLLQLQESTSKQRNEKLIMLKDIISDPITKAFNKPAILSSVHILVEMRAIETVDILLDMVDYGYLIGSRITPPFADFITLSKNYEIVKALIEIHPPYESVLNKLADEDSIIRFRCYTTILVETEGVDVSRFIIQKAIEKETDERKLSRLYSALNMLNKDFPVEEKKENKDQ